MKNVPIPVSFSDQLKHANVQTIGPPPGISREHCVDAEVCVTDDWSDDGMGLGFTMFFEPDEEELEAIKNGALLKVQIRGYALVPHSLGIW